jgi:two-component system CitB family sensor kinase
LWSWEEVRVDRLRHLSLAGQLLALQLVLVLLVLVCVALVSYAQSEAAFEREQGRRALSVAESVAGSPVIRRELEVGPHTDVVGTIAESARSVSGLDEVLVARVDRLVVASSDPDLLGSRVELGAGGAVLSGRAWLGRATYSGRPTLTAYVPVQDADGDLAGLVGASTVRPYWWEVLRDDTPRLLVYLGVASALGVAGSLLLARRVKRQTLGLEPQAIASLAEHRDAMLEGVREGVIGVDDDSRVTLANDEARHLLGLPADVVGRDLLSLGLPEGLVDVLSGRQPGADVVVVHGDRMLVANRRPIASHGRSLGSVTTLRDRTELVTLQSELDATKVATSTLRAQAHEFDNRLHVIAGLVELEDYDEVVRYVHAVRRQRAELDADVTEHVRDKAVAALLAAKSSLATERRVRLVISPRTSLDPVDDGLTSDLVTVVGRGGAGGAAGRAGGRRTGEGLRAGCPRRAARGRLPGGLQHEGRRGPARVRVGADPARLRAPGRVRDRGRVRLRGPPALRAGAGGLVIRVVVVDDDFMVAKIHSGWVARTPGFEVVAVAHSVAEAAHAVAEHHPDLLLLDVYLPDGTGIDLLQDLRHDGHEVDALMVTAARDVETVQRALRRGAVSYVVKPFEYDVLRERLEQYAVRREQLPATVAQSDVDALFERRGRTASGAGLPKGLAPETVRLVVAALEGCPEDMSAAECGEATGLSRVSARRYLEHLTTTGRAQVSLRYGTAGRPERRYRWVRAVR